jgi:hypothetical protein
LRPPSGRNDVVKRGSLVAVVSLQRLKGEALRRNGLPAA